KTWERVRHCLKVYFRDARNGLSDNEDMGCQSAFFMCSSMGLYPLMGQDLYFLTAPLFKKTTLTMGDSGNTLVIEAPLADEEHRYIVGATLNGVPLDRAWIRHGEIADGAVLKLELATAPNGFGQDNIPPSPADAIR
ncbi:MAG: glycoside hydrolase family 92 protein, partial [Clostridia bacterium]|nr:glycoside hydrolase family 92 protein [Clostridia bacterium]